MSSDFLHEDAEMRLCERYVAGGAICSLSTNCQYVLDAAQDSFFPVDLPLTSVDFSVRFWVDNTDPAQPPWPKPYVRGLNHLIYASFDAGSSLLADLRTRRVIGRFSPGMASDTAYWKTVIFPMLLTIVGASVGIAELHCACVTRNRNGLLLAGSSGSGKSTLALALSQIGFGFLSDDRTFCSLKNGSVLAWGLPTRLKLRREAAKWFEELRYAQPIDTQGEIWLEPEHFLGLTRVQRCQPHSLLFLERQEASKFRLSRMSSSEASNRLRGDLMGELPDAFARRSAAVEKLVELPCWLLQYGGQPQAIALQISEHFATC
jgi:hypothetical protein